VFAKAADSRWGSKGRRFESCRPDMRGLFAASGGKPLFFLPQPDAALSAETSGFLTIGTPSNSR
jgi:hypothetical protein